MGESIRQLALIGVRGAIGPPPALLMAGADGTSFVFFSPFEKKPPDPADVVGGVGEVAWRSLQDDSAVSVHSACPRESDHPGHGRDRPTPVRGLRFAWGVGEYKEVSLRFRCEREAAVPTLRRAICWVLARPERARAPNRLETRTIRSETVTSTPGSGQCARSEGTEQGGDELKVQRQTSATVSARRGPERMARLKGGSGGGGEPGGCLSAALVTGYGPVTSRPGVDCCV